MSEKYQKFQSLLEENYTFPCRYQYKFIVTAENKEKLLSLFPGAHVSQKPSRSGKYTSYTISREERSASGIIASYQSCEKIENLITL